MIAPIFGTVKPMKCQFVIGFPEHPAIFHLVNRKMTMKKMIKNHLLFFVYFNY